MSGSLPYLQKPVVHYRIYKSPPLLPVLSHMNVLHPSPPYFFKIYINIILPSEAGTAQSVERLGYAVDD
jgi:hypothetical protein